MKTTLSIYKLVMALLLGSQLAFGQTTYYVRTTAQGGNDSNNGTSTGTAFRTIHHALSVAGSGATVNVGAGIFVEAAPLTVPLGVSIVGAGLASTTIKADPSFYFHNDSGKFHLEKAFMQLVSSSRVTGNHNLSDFTIDGDDRELWMGIYVRERDNVNINRVKVMDTYFSGIWLWATDDSELKNSELENCAWGSVGFASGALNIGNADDLEIGFLDVDEDNGYGIKAVGPTSHTDINRLDIHDSHISVIPVGSWHDGQAPNIAIELWQTHLSGCKIRDSYVDNTISLVHANSTSATGVQTIHVYNNNIDLVTRAMGEGYGIELTMHDVEIDHNYFNTGTYGIANWASACQGWNIHHNVFYGLHGTYPGEVLRSETSGLHYVTFRNNTMEFDKNSTTGVIGLYGGTSDHIEITNNLILNEDTGQTFWPNQFIHLDNATIGTTTVRKNMFFRLDSANVSGVTYLGNYRVNTTGQEGVSKTTPRPDPYYQPVSNSLIDKGYAYTGAVFNGSAPDIGAYESTPNLFSVTLESQDAVKTGAMTLGTDGTAISGSYVYVPSGGTNFFIPPSAVATWEVEIPEACSCELWAHVKTTSGHSGYHLYDGQGHWTSSWDAGVHSSWTWVHVMSGATPITMSFPAGTNHVGFGWYQDNAKIDEVVVTNDPSYDPNSSGFMRMSAYPNPASDEITLEDDSAGDQDAMVTIHDASSTPVHQQRVRMSDGSNRIDLNNLALKDGTYILKYHRADGKRSTMRILIRH